MRKWMQKKTQDDFMARNPRNEAEWNTISFHCISQKVLQEDSVKWTMVLPQPCWVGEELGVGVEGTSQSIKNRWVRVWWKLLAFPLEQMWSEWPTNSYREWLLFQIEQWTEKQNTGGNKDSKKKNNKRKTSSVCQCQLKIISVHYWMVVLMLYIKIIPSF